MSAARRGTIRVLAGTNGAGKSSVAGEHLRTAGANYFNPDEIARELLAAGVAETLAEANSQAWHRGVAELERASARRTDFTFETTLGANTIPRLLERAAGEGLAVHVWYVGSRER